MDDKQEKKEKRKIKWLKYKILFFNWCFALFSMFYFSNTLINATKSDYCINHYIFHCAIIFNAGLAYYYLKEFASHSYYKLFDTFPWSKTVFSQKEKDLIVNQSNLFQENIKSIYQEKIKDLKKMKEIAVEMETLKTVSPNDKKIKHKIL